MSTSKKTRTLKVQPKKTNITKFIMSGKLINTNQLKTIQRHVVDSLIRTGASSDEIKKFVQSSNRLKKSITTKSTSKIAANNFRNLLNYGDVVRHDDGKYSFRIHKPRLSAVSKTLGEKDFNQNLLKSLKRQGILSKSSEKIIKQRKNRKDNSLTQIKNSKIYGEIVDILKSMDNISKYWVDVKRMLFDYLGLELDESQIKEMIN